MSVSPVETDFKSIFDAIDEISKFINLAVGDSLDVDTIKEILSTSHYIEALIDGLTKNGLSEIFEIKLNEYLKTKDKIFVINIQQLEKCCDDVLNKIITLNPKNELITKAIGEYVKILGYSRFETLINHLSNLRALYVKLSHATKNICTPSEVSSSFLIQSWLKIIDSAENGRSEIETILHRLFSNVENVEILITILNVERTENVQVIQNILGEVVYSEVSTCPFSSSWNAILQSDRFLNVTINNPRCLDAALKTFELMESRYEFDTVNLIWTVKNSDVIDYSTFIKIFTSLYETECFHFKIKRFVRVRKAVGFTEFWEFVEKDLGIQK